MVICTVVFLIARTGNKFKSLPLLEWISAWSCDHSKEYYIIIKMNKNVAINNIMSESQTQFGVKEVRLKRKHIVWFYIKFTN